MATFKINGKNFATQDGTGAATIHSDVVFPSGHIIQTQTFIHNTQSASTNTDSSTFVATPLVRAITPKVSGSKIVIQVSSPIRADGGGNQEVVQRLYYSTDGTNFSALHSKHNTFMTGNGAEMNQSFTTVDDGTGTSVVAGTERTYKVYIALTDGTFGRYGSYLEVSNVQGCMVVTEIQT